MELSAFFRGIADMAIAQSWQGSIVSVAAGGLALALRRTPARVRFGLWSIALLGFLVPRAPIGLQFEPSGAGVLSSLLGGLERPAWMHLAGGAAISGVASDASSSEATLAKGAASRAAVETTATGGRSAGSPEGTDATRDGSAGLAAASEAEALGVPEVLGIAYLAIVLFLLGSFANQVLRLRRLVGLAESAPPEAQAALARAAEALGMRRKVALGISDAIAGPFVVGVFRPRILIPRHTLEVLASRELDTVLIHELIHVRRWDLAVHLLSSLLRIFQFFNPLAHAVASRLARERERAVDETVLIRGGREFHEYGSTLLAVAASAPRLVPAGGTSLGLSETGRDLLGRLSDLKRSRGVPARWWLLVPAVLALAIVAAAPTPRTLPSRTGEARTGEPGPSSTSSASNTSNTSSPWTKDAAEPAHAAEPGPADTPAEAAPQPPLLPPESETETHMLRRFAGAMTTGEPAEIQRFLDDGEAEDTELLTAFSRAFRSLCDAPEAFPLVHFARISPDKVWAAFYTGRPGPAGGDGRGPIFFVFEKVASEWKTSLFQQLRNVASAVESSPEVIGRRSVARSVSGMRFGRLSMAERSAFLAAQADAFDLLAKPPYDFTAGKAAAESLRQQSKSMLAFGDRKWEEIEKQMLSDVKEEHLAKADDFYLAFYLEAREGAARWRLPRAEGGEPFDAERFPVLVDDDVLRAWVEETGKDGTGMPSVHVKLSRSGTMIFANATRDHIGKKLAIAIEGKVVSAPVIRSAIEGGDCVIVGNFTRMEVQAIARELNSYRERLLGFFGEMQQKSPEKAREGKAAKAAK